MRYFFAVMRFTLTSLVALLLVLLMVVLEGCVVGPRYVKPSVPAKPNYKEETPASFKDLDQWQPAHPGDRISRGNWWVIFGDPELNKLEEQIADSNQDLKVAEARFREARAAIRFNRAARFPTISTRRAPAM
jgi:outer membrane protein TolC